MEPSDVISIVALIASFVVGGAGTVIAILAHQRAGRAEEESEKLRHHTLWSGVTYYLHEALTANVQTMDMIPILNGLRRSSQELVDGLPDGEWPHLDEWLGMETMLASGLLTQTSEELRLGAATIGEVVAAHQNYALWAGALLSNLRQMRKRGPTQATLQQIIELRDRAAKLLEQIQRGETIHLRFDPLEGEDVPL